MALATGTRMGPYEILGSLGAGGMGEVYRARDTKLQREVAIKILPPAFATDPDRLARFEREAQVLASLNHPNIAAIYGFEDKALVLELVDGPTLADRIAQGPVPVDEALPIARQIAEALEAAHEHGVVHRDLKPANIKLRADGTVKVLDFGLARALGPADVGSQLPSALSISPTVMSPAMTQTGVILGTAAYMSPEQARGKAVDRRADIWAFGCVLYEMLTGLAPFADEDASLTLSKVLQRDVEWSAIPATATHIEPLLRRCLEKDPRVRLRDIGEARIALDPTARPAMGRSPAADIRGRRRSIPVAAAGVAVLVTAALVGAAAWSMRPSATAPSMPVVRLTVTLPPGERLANALGAGANSWMPIAISPDGTQLAYTGTQLFLRSMNSLDVRTTQGTDGAQSPFFSPDGQWVGFFAQGQLRKVSVTGGLPTRITDAPIAAGASWAEDGWIYFAPTNMSGISRVSADGGQPEAVTTLNREKGEVSHRWPSVMPGGKALLLTVWRGPGWDEMDVQLHDLATGMRTVVVQGATTGRYVASGHVVAGRAGQLTAVPFDLARAAVTGPPIQLGIEVRDGEGALFTVSDTGLLAYVPGRTQREHRLVSIARDGAVSDLGAPVRAYEDVIPSPDGRRLATTVQGGTWGVWVFELARKTETLLTRGATSQWPIWTRDGTRIVYRGTRLGFRNLYWRSADGTGEEERLTTGETIETPESVSPDGKWLLYTTTTPTTGLDIWRVSFAVPRVPEPLIASAATEGSPQVSRDGRWIAFTSDESGRTQVYVQPFPDSGERIAVSSDGGDRPRWSRDGRRLYFLAADTVMEAEVATTPTLRVATPRPFVKFTDLLAEYDVAPDGGLFGIRRPDSTVSTTQIHVVVNWFEELRQRVLAK